MCMVSVVINAEKESKAREGNQGGRGCVFCGPVREGLSDGVMEWRLQEKALPVCGGRESQTGRGSGAKAVR